MRAISPKALLTCDGLDQLTVADDAQRSRGHRVGHLSPESPSWKTVVPARTATGSSSFATPSSSGAGKAAKMGIARRRRIWTAAARQPSRRRRRKRRQIPATRTRARAAGARSAARRPPIAEVTRTSTTPRTIPTSINDSRIENKLAMTCGGVERCRRVRLVTSKIDPESPTTATSTNTVATRGVALISASVATATANVNTSGPLSGGAAQSGRPSRIRRRPPRHRWRH